MRTTSIVILAIVLFASTNALTSQDIIRAINLARKNPHTIRDKIKAKYGNMPGPASDPTCYTDTINFLNVKPGLPPLVENMCADLSAWQHSKFCVKVLNKIDQIGERGTTPFTRVFDNGWWFGNAAVHEMIAQILRPDAIYPSADDFVMLWITDCGNPTTKLHRAKVFETVLPEIGCGVYQGPMTENGKTLTGTVATCDGVAQGLVIRKMVEWQLPEAGLTKATNSMRFTGV